jgi:hypothetical protein
MINKLQKAENSGADRREFFPELAIADLGQWVECQHQPAVMTVLVNGARSPET